VAIGVKPNTEIAKIAGLEIDSVNDGILCNGQLQISSGLYAAGDVASYYDVMHGRQRVAHQWNSYMSGQAAAKAMLGKDDLYFQPSIFWGKICGNDYSGIGKVDSKMETVGIWLKGTQEDWESAPKESRNNSWENAGEYRRGIVYYMKDQQVVGVVLWNLPKMLVKAHDRIGLSKSGRLYTKPSELIRGVPFGYHDKEEEEGEQKGVKKVLSGQNKQL